jgi:hypothetical protein
LAVKFATFTTTVIVPALVPEAGGGTLSHVPLVTEADQLMVPPPVLATVTIWFSGLLPPCVAVNDNELVLNPIAGAGDATFKVTDMG